jgi:hypothetical protein
MTAYDITFTEASPRELRICADLNHEADWHYNVTTIPGTYAVLCTTDQGRPCSLEDAYWVFVTIDATCTGGYIPGYKGANVAEQKVGQPMPYSSQIYGFMVRDSLAKEGTPYAKVPRR